MPADAARRQAGDRCRRRPGLEMRGIGKRFPGVLALENVDLALEPGKVHALMGENGAGKSTLIKIMAGVYQKDAGTIRIGGARGRAAIAARRAAAGHQGGVPGDRADLRVHRRREHFPRGLSDERASARSAGARSARMQRRCSRGSASTSIPAAKVGSLPVSQQQMVEIARALAHEARIVVMDEPTSSLTPNEVALLFAVIRRLTGLGIAVLYVSHKLDEVFEIADTVTVLRDGRHISTKPIGEHTNDTPDPGHDRAAHREPVSALARHSAGAR